MTVSISQWNLYKYAYHIKNEDARICVIGDSINSQETPYRMCLGYWLTWRPAAWKGYTHISGGSVQDNFGTGGCVSDSAHRFTGAQSVMAWVPFGTAGQANNRYDFVGGTKAHNLGTTTYDFATASESSTPSNTKATALIPVCYREQHFPAGVASGVVIGSLQLTGGDTTNPITGDSVSNTYTNTDIFATNANIKIRMVWMKNADGPTSIDFVPQHAGAGTTTTVNMNGAAALQTTDCAIPSGTGATYQVQVKTNGSTGIAGNDKVMVIAGGRIWDSGLATGLQMMFWCNSGWDTNDFLDTSIIANADLAVWLSAMIGNGVGGAAGRDNGPSLFWMQLGQNDTGSYVRATFKTNYLNVMARLRTVSALNGVDNPRFVCVAPYLGNTGAAASVYADMADVILEIAKEQNAGYINLNTLVPGPNGLYVGVESSAVANINSRILSDTIHPDTSGSLFLTGQLWGQIEAALALGENTPWRINR